MRKNEIKFMNDYCIEHGYDVTDMQVSEVINLLEAYGDHVAEATKELIFKTQKDIKDGTR